MNREYQKEWYSNNREKMLKYHREYRIKNKEYIRELNKDYYKKNKEKRKQSCSEWREKNQEYTRLRDREYKKKNILKIKEYKSTVNYRIRHRLRQRITAVLKGRKKSMKTMELVGCSVDYLKGFLEAKFKPGMTWNNYGEWHIDHIVPCVKFDLSIKEEQEKCFHYSNLQPLWAVENLRKGIS